MISTDFLPTKFLEKDMFTFVEAFRKNGRL